MLSKAARHKLDKLFNVWVHLSATERERLRFVLSEYGDSGERWYPRTPQGSMVREVGYWERGRNLNPIAVDAKHRINTPEAAALLAEVEAYWASIATPERIAAVEAQQRQAAAEREAETTQRGREVIGQVARLIYRHTGMVNWTYLEEWQRDQILDAARAVIQWAASADRADLQAAAQVAGKEGQ